MNPTLIKPVLIVLTGLFIVFMLSGCVVAPYEPVVVSPPPPAAVVVRPAHGHYHHGYHHGRHWRRGHR